MKVVGEQVPKMLPTSITLILAISASTQINNTFLFCGTVLTIGLATVIINYSLNHYYSYKLKNLTIPDYSMKAKITEKILIGLPGNRTQNPPVKSRMLYH